MASRKEYTYQIKGSKLSLLEKDFTTADGLNLAGVSTSGAQYGTSGDGLTDDIPSGSTKYKSPLTAVTDGIEIEYAYSPEYRLAANFDQQGSVRTFKPLCYLSIGDGTTSGYLAFGLPDFDFSGDFSTGGGTQTFTVGEDILIQGSSRWNGIHKIHYVTHLGLLVTTTRLSEYSNIGVTVDITADKKITGDTDGNKADIANLFPSGTHYCWVGTAGSPGAQADTHAELFKVTSDGAGVLTMTAKYTVTAGTVTEATTFTVTESLNDGIGLAKAFYDPCDMYQNLSFETMTDESFEIDVPPYLSKALVYYVKAKVAEDQMNIEVKEYMMREFKRMLEKHESSKVSGSRMIMSGRNAIR